MKYLSLYASLAISVLLTGCANNEITEKANIDYQHQGKAIGVQTYIPRYTRAGDENALNYLTEGFALLATSGEETIIEETTFYANAETHTCTSTDNVTYNWPLGDAEVNFYAWYPAYPTNGDDMIGISDAIPDALGAIAKAKESDNNGNVSLVFHHLSSKVTLHVKCFEDAPQATFQVEEIALYGPTESTYNVKTGKVTVNDNSGENMWIQYDSNSHSVDFSSEQYSTLGTAVIPASSATTDDQGAITMTTTCTISAKYSVTIGAHTKTYNKTATFNVASGYASEVKVSLTCDIPMSIAVNVNPWQVGEEHTFSTNETNGDAGAHEYVDLGLPSGTLWATCNIGASKPEEFGDYFAWGETEPHYTVVGNDTIWKEGYEDGYAWSNYKYCMGTDNTLTKYQTQSDEPFNYGYNGFIDGINVLESSDDAATMNWGGKWRMPTYDELVELLLYDTYCTREQTKVNNVDGILVTSKSNGNSVFFPIAGQYRGTTKYIFENWFPIPANELSTQESQSCYIGALEYEWDFGFHPGNYIERCNGYTIRPVLPAE